MSGFISEERHIGLCLPEFGQDEILAVLPPDFVSHENLSHWVHQRAENRLLGFDLSRDNSPGRTLRTAGVPADLVVEVCKKLALLFWENEYEKVVATFGFAPNLGGRMDAPTLGKEAQQRRVKNAVARGDLPTLKEWGEETPLDWVEKLVGVAD